MENNLMIANTLKVDDMYLNMIDQLEELVITIEDLSVSTRSLNLAKLSENKIEINQYLSINNTLVGLPIGSVVPFSINTDCPPVGWLFCDGSSFEKDEYSLLYAVMGGNNKLPDLNNNKMVKFDPQKAINSKGGESKIILDQTNFQKRKFYDCKNVPYVAANTDSNIWPFSNKKYHIINNTTSGSGRTIEIVNNDPKEIDITPPNLKMRYIIKAF